MSLRPQLDRLMPALSGRERAIIVLRNFKEGKPQDHGIARGMSPEEARVYNQLMRLINVCNQDLVSLIGLIGQSVERQSLRLAWLFSLTMWEMHALEVNDYLAECTREPVTESEYRERQRKARKHPTRPKWGAAYDVRPDGEAEQVVLERGRRGKIQKRLKQILTDDDRAPWWTQGSRHLTLAIEKGLKGIWSEVLALEVVLDEVAEEFEGDDVLKPALREEIEAAKIKALDIHTAIQDWTGPFELPEADQDAVKQTRDLVERWAENRR